MQLVLLDSESLQTFQGKSTGNLIFQLVENKSFQLLSNSLSVTRTSPRKDKFLQLPEPKTQPPLPNKRKYRYVPLGCKCMPKLHHIQRSFEWHQFSAERRMRELSFLEMPPVRSSNHLEFTSKDVGLDKPSEESELQMHPSRPSPRSLNPRSCFN